MKSDDSGCKIAVYKYKIKRFLEADVQHVLLKEMKQISSDEIEMIDELGKIYQMNIRTKKMVVK